MQNDYVSNPSLYWEYYKSEGVQGGKQGIALKL